MWTTTLRAGRPGRSLLVALAMTVLAACGASGQSEGGGDDASGTSVVESAQDAGALRVGVAAAPPYQDLNSDTNEWEGVAIDFAERWADALGVKTEYVSTQFGVIVAGLQSGRFDMTPVLNETPEREGTVLFSEPLVTALSAAAVIPGRDGIDSWEKLDDAANTICVATGSADDATLTGYGPKAQVLRLADLNACRLALQSGRAQAVFDEWHTHGQYADTTPEVRVLFPPDPLGEQAISAALSTSASQDDLASLNEAIEDFRDSGALAESMTKWGAVNPLDFAVGQIPDYAREQAASEFSAE